MTSNDWDEVMNEAGLRESPLSRFLKRTLDENLHAQTPCVCLSTPPQEGKTSFITAYIVWLLMRDPWLRIVYASYGMKRALAVSRRVRALLQHWVPLRKGDQSVSRWSTVWGGGLLSAGRGSALTGFSADLVIIDDPVKNLQEARTQQPVIEEWVDTVVLTRLSRGASVILVSTRWTTDDTQAFLEKKPGTRSYCIPAQAESGDPLGRSPGEWLESIQGRTASDWEHIRDSIGEYAWLALYQGSPSPRRGSLICVDAIRRVPASDIVFSREGKFYPVQPGATVIQSWDLALGDSSLERGDYVAGHTYVHSGSWWLADRVHGRMSFTQSIEAIRDMAKRWPTAQQVLVEKAASGAAAIDVLRAEIPGLRAVVPKGSKVSRVQAIIPVIDSGGLRILDSAWDDGMVQEMRVFPYGKHDDDVDALSQALSCDDWMMIL